MINLQTRNENSLKTLENEISIFNEKADLLDFFKRFIKKYKNLDNKFSFTEYLDEEFILNQIDLKFTRKEAPLFCIPYGIKDIFNTRILPTSMGSDIWRGFKSGNNARVVDSLAENGGIIFSKTTTAEFAVHFISPESTLNPYNENHITGTSSSGSAVAVSCGALPVALGTQTAGSIIRPASFCGVYGFKPSFGAIDRTGVLKTNDTFDTIGLLGSDIYGLRKTFYSILQKGSDYPFSSNYFNLFEQYNKKAYKNLRIGYISEKLEVYNGFHDYVKNDFEEVKDILSKVFSLMPVINIDFANEIHILHEKMYSKSLSYYFKNEMKNNEFVSDIMQDMIERGDKITTESYISAVQKQPLLKKKFDQIFNEFDFIIVPSTATYAPLLSEVETKDTCLIWTYLGYPVISIPLFIDKEKKLPYGLQIIAKKFDDFALLKFSELIQSFFN